MLSPSAPLPIAYFSYQHPHIYFPFYYAQQRSPAKMGIGPAERFAWIGSVCCTLEYHGTSAGVTRHGRAQDEFFGASPMACGMAQSKTMGVCAVHHCMYLTATFVCRSTVLDVLMMLSPPTFVRIFMTILIPCFCESGGTFLRF